uniref:NADH dehydrogenase subunit 4L n=1 Tax=Gymnothorax pseudothyrsoideus TaxID=454040 RepID=UPI001E7F8011|nr:NADH dehydrogenase subunit 4L [Gymnothorax pseudothyrsoideus]YP_010959663.1 NADH dehydrogenase subunit 4L [Gymnothorax odishi]UEX93243.1 NADH dehydrogenase subunit 4L [Gymnothorax reevesii]QSV37219.1 NADH dehydrogenase subunit 4L [Gymnothorax pseudothyrsoideus]UEX93113.1 NADH dehydrogenase subunit 4L [Gymnothorax pseudothyrsoideus]WNE91112.1 NADH dehydrogenase subunit 4L [Gymnothorax odishi]
MTPTHFTFTLAFTLGLSGLAFHRKHLLSALLCLEAMMLSLYVGLALWSIQMNSSVFSSTPMMLLAFSACEASAGLALLVATSRTHGTDHLKALNLLQC